MDKQNNLAVILLAAGQGVRLGGQRKLDLTVNGDRYLDHLVTLLSDFTAHVIVAVSADDMKILSAAQKQLPCQFVIGGATRQASFENAMAALPQTTTRVLLHEVARPLLSRDLLKRVLQAADDHDAVVSTISIPVRDSIALQSGGEIDDILPRDKLVLLQTPQVFNLQTLQSILAMARAKGWQENSHVALAKKAGITVFAVEGEETNIKVTYPEDITTVQNMAAAMAHAIKG
jgi:2-C-methyl-D-erythritol 4-phosphate cytidylyltransferase